MIIIVFFVFVFVFVFVSAFVESENDEKNKRLKELQEDLNNAFLQVTTFLMYLPEPELELEP
jgi:hypothetical protein